MQFKYEGVQLPANFLHSLAAKLCVRRQNIFEVQEHARGPFSPCHVWWAQTSHAAKGVKNFEIFVCLSVTFLNGKV